MGSGLQCREQTAPGTRVIKVVYKVNKGLFAIHYRLKDSEQELADAVVIIMTVKNTMFPLLNTSKQKEIAGYRAINPSLRSQHPAQGVNDVVFEYEKSDKIQSNFDVTCCSSRR